MRKWKWRLLTNKEAIWAGSSSHRYGELNLKMLNAEEVSTQQWV